ncbi:MAG: WD40 repeat domain-containing protein, partial [Anaerolineae bacterium]|nr:WD40 repeat domain-containing protein [Anaerolineae bacterium]
ALAIAANEIPNPPVEARDALQQIAFAPGIRDWLVTPEDTQYNDLGFTPDGSRLLAAHTRRTGNWVGIVNMWDISSGQIIHSFQNEMSFITDIEISHDGNLLAIAGCGRDRYINCNRGRIEIWDINTFELKYAFEYFEQFVNAIDFAKNSLRLASIGCHEVTENPELPPDQRRYSSICAESEIILWDIESDRKESAIIPAATLSDIAIHPDGNTLVTGGAKCVEGQIICEEGEIIIWDTETLEPILHITPINPLTELPERGVGDVNYDYSAAYIVSRTSGSFAIWNSQTGELVDSEWRLSVGGADMSLYGPYNSVDSLLVTSDFETVIVEDLFADSVMLEFAGHTGTVNDVEFSLDGRLVASADSDGTIILWAVKPGNVIQNLDFRFELLPDANQNVIFDDRYLLTQTCDQREESGCYEISLVLWDVEDQSIEVTIPSISVVPPATGEGLWISAVGFDLEAGKLAIGMNDRSISVFDTNTQQLLQTYTPNPLPQSDEAGIKRIAIYDENTIISSNCENVNIPWYPCLDEIVVWDIISNSPTVRIPIDFVHALSSAGEYAVASRCLPEFPSCDSYSMMLISVMNSETLWEITRDFSRIVNVAFDITQEYIVILHESTDEDGVNNSSRHQEVTVLDKAGSIVAQNVILPADTRAVRYNAQNGTIVALSTDHQNNRETVWSISTGEKLIVLQDTLGSSYLSDSGQILTTGRLGSTVRRIYSYTELLDWVGKNRYTLDLTCAERNQYSIEPLCAPDVSDLRVTPFPTPAPIEVTPAEVKPFDVIQDTPINIGEVIDATLFANATDVWVLNGQAGDVIDIIVSAQFDSTVELFNSEGFSLAFNDNFSEDPGDSRILGFRLPWTEEYTIKVWGDSEGLLGEEYSLLVTDAGITGNSGSDSVLSISINETGFLQPGESHYWTFEASAGDIVDISVVAEFDSFITLSDAFGTELALGDDFEGNVGDSRILSQRIPTDGSYVIEVHNLAIISFSSGNYQIVVNRANDGSAGVNRSASDTNTCNVRTSFDVNLRAGPGTTYSQDGSRARNTVILADAQTQGADGYIWWRVGDMTEDRGLWVREDVVLEDDDCRQLPVIASNP